jgi:hypothetical protein
MTLQELIDTFYVYAGDFVGDRWPRERIVGMLNVAQDELVTVIESSNSEYFSKIATLAVVASSELDYQFDVSANITDFRLPIKMWAVSSTGNESPMTRLNIAEKSLENYPSTFFENSALGEAVWYLRGNHITIVRPKNSYTARLDYLYQPARLKDDGDVSEIPVGFHHLVARMAAKNAYGIEGRTFPPQENESITEQKRFLQGHVSRRGDAPIAVGEIDYY